MDCSASPARRKASRPVSRHAAPPLPGRRSSTRARTGTPWATQRPSCSGTDERAPGKRRPKEIACGRMTFRSLRILARRRARQTSPLEQAQELRLHVSVRRLAATVACHDHQMHSGFRQQALVPPICFSHQALGSITSHRPTDPPAGHEPRLTRKLGSQPDEQDKQGRAVGLTLVIDALEFGTMPDAFRSGESLVGAALSGHYAERRARPFARRRFNTRRPFFVFILWRKPCFFFLRRL